MTQPTRIPTPPTDAQIAIRWAVEVAADPAAVFLDTETTGLGPDAEICDIAIVAGNGRVLLDTLVRPLRPIPAAATAIHGIADGDVVEAPRWSELVLDVAMLLRDCRVVVYNAEFDARVVNGVCRPLGLEIAKGWQCAMEAYAAFDGTPVASAGRPPKPGERRYKWRSLETAARRFGLEPGGHRALADAEVCRKVVLAMAEGVR